MNVFFASRTPAPITDDIRTRPLYVTNCGYYHNITENISILRKFPREDYHILYVKSGKILVENETLTDGWFYVYAPGERQCYTYTACERCHYLWVHFLGTDVPEIFRQLGLASGAFHLNDRTGDMEKIWLLLCDAVQFRQGNPDGYAASLLLSALHLMTAPRISRSPFSGAAKLLEDFTAKVTVPALAQKYRMSTGHFIECFKKAYGAAPMQYRAGKQFEQAKLLIREMDIPISAVAELCGFYDPLYFSRQFKKYAGVSPTEYKKQISDHEITKK